MNAHHWDIQVCTMFALHQEQKHAHAFIHTFKLTQLIPLSIMEQKNQQINENLYCVCH